MSAPSEHLARALLPPDVESVRRSEARPVLTADLIDRALLAVAGLAFGYGLLLLWQCLTWGL